MTTSDPQVDLFILHSEADDNWVEYWLIPRLTEAGISTATHEDFRVGRTVALNYEEAVEHSRYVAFVLSPEGLEDRWAAFAASLALHRDPANLTERLLPLRVRPCPQLPRPLRNLTAADFTDLGASEAELHKLISQLRDEPSNARGMTAFSSSVRLSQMLQTIRRHPLMAALAMLVAVLVALFAIYDNSGLREAYPIFGDGTSAPSLSPAFPPATEDETLVLIANLAAVGLDHPDDCSDVDDPRRMTQTLVDGMRQQLSAHPQIRVERLCRFVAAEGGSDTAVAIGEDPAFNAAIVIWGDYVAQPDPELYLHFDIIRSQETYLRGGFDEAYGPGLVSQPDMFDFKVRLGEYLGSVTAFAVGLSLYEADAHKEAELLFTTASQIIDSNLAAEITDAILFYRGTNYLDLGRANLAALDLAVLVADPQLVDAQSGSIVIAALGNLGIAYKNLGEYAKAIDYYTHALGIAQGIGDRQGEGNHLGNLGNAYRNLGGYAKAIDFYTQSLAIAQELGDRQDEGSTLGNLGGAYDLLGEYAKATDFYTQALAIAQELGDRRGEGSTLGNLGTTYDNLGEYAVAIDFYTQSLAIAQELGNRRSEGNALGNLGIAYDNLGEYAKAIDFHIQALTIAQEIGDRQGEGNRLVNLGIAYGNLGEYAKAIDFYTQALAIAQEIGDRRSEGNALGSLGMAYDNLGEYAKAIDFYTQALAIAQEIGDRQGESNRLGNLGIAYHNLGEYAKAIDFYTQALAIDQEIGDHRDAAFTGWNLGLIYAEQGDFAQAAEVMQPLVDFYQEIDHPDAEKLAETVEEYRRRAAAEE